MTPLAPAATATSDPTLALEITCSVVTKPKVLKSQKRLAQPWVAIQLAKIFA